MFYIRLLIVNIKSCPWTGCILAWEHQRLEEDEETNKPTACFNGIGECWKMEVNL